MKTREEYRKGFAPEILEWRYWNTQEAAVLIVAVEVSWSGNGWCAYIGASIDAREIEEAGVMTVRRRGDMLHEDEARAFFPSFDDRTYIYD